MMDIFLEEKKRETAFVVNPRVSNDTFLDRVAALLSPPPSLPSLSPLPPTWQVGVGGDGSRLSSA